MVLLSFIHAFLIINGNALLTLLHCHADHVTLNSFSSFILFIYLNFQYFTIIFIFILFQLKGHTTGIYGYILLNTMYYDVTWKALLSDISIFSIISAMPFISPQPPTN